MAQILPPGTAAPEFKLRVTPDQWLSLSDLKGGPVILAFYPADWSPVCGDQMAHVPEAARRQVRFVWLERVDDAVAAALDAPAGERADRDISSRESASGGRQAARSV